MINIIKTLSLYTTTITFWLSLIGMVFIYFHPKIRNYVVPGKKRMSFVQAGTLMFTGLYSSSVLYWSFFESVLFKDDPSFIALFPDKVGNSAFLTAMTMYNWGITLYIMSFIGIIVVIFVAKYKNIYLAPKYEKLLAIIFIFLALFSATRIMVSLASYIIPLKFILGMFSKYNGSLFVVGALVIATFWSVSGGLPHIKKFANICAIFIATYTIIFVVKLFLLNNGASYMADATKEFLMLVVNPNFIKAQFSFNNKFIGDWTILFTTTQIVAVWPALYFFYILMQGRTIKEFILLFNITVIIPTFLIFAINSSLVQILSKANNMVLNPDNYFDMYQVIFNYVNMGKFPAIILFLSMFTLIVTSVDSIIYACAKYLKVPIFDGEDAKETKKVHSKKYLIFAVSFLLLLAGFLLYVLSFKSKPAIAVRLYELNFVSGIAIFLPLLYMTYRVIRSFYKKDINK